MQVLEEMIAVWREAGPDAKDIFLMQKLQVLLSAMADTIGQIQIDRVTMLPDGGGNTAAVQAARLVEELKGAVGVDLPKLLGQAVTRT